MSEQRLDSEPALCGIDVRGRGTCWGARSAPQDLGDGVKSIGISRYGTCAVKAATAPSAARAPCSHRRATAATFRSGWADFSLGIDDTGMPVSSLRGLYEFPVATYVRIAMMSSSSPAAIRSDGALVYLGPTGKVAMVMPGPFVDLTLTWRGHLCAVAAAGEVTCFSVAANAPPPPVAPPGPFKRSRPAFSLAVRPSTQPARPPAGATSRCMCRTAGSDGRPRHLDPIADRVIVEST